MPISTFEDQMQHNRSWSLYQSYDNPRYLDLSGQTITTVNLDGVNVLFAARLMSMWEYATTVAVAIARYMVVLRPVTGAEFTLAMQTIIAANAVAMGMVTDFARYDLKKQSYRKLLLVNHALFIKTPHATREM